MKDLIRKSFLLKVTGLFMLSFPILTVCDIQAQDVFESPVYYDVGTGPRDVASSDLNNDNVPDLAVANQLSSNVSVLLNNGNGTFQSHVDYIVGGAPRALVIGVINDDPYPDIVTSNSASDKVSILINNGDGTFADVVHYSVGSEPWGVVSGDLNGDEFIDVAVVNRESKTFSVLLNNGSGTLSLSGSFAAGGASTHPYWITAADYTGDDALDIAVTKFWSSYIFTQGIVEIFHNDGTGTFTSVATIDIGPDATTPLSIDLDGDEDIDLAVTGFVDSSNKVTSLLNDGTGMFTSQTAYYAGASGRAVAGDFDSDNDYDVVISEEGVYASGISVVFNDGTGAFESPYIESAGSQPQGMAVGFFDEDSDIDLACAIHDENHVAVFLNTTNPTPTPTPECSYNGDVTQDGVITAADAQLAFQIALGYYQPTFEEECAADCNGDGEVTAGDAQTIFAAALGLMECVDPL